jgi:hypothetical protein
MRLNIRDHMIEAGTKLRLYIEDDEGFARKCTNPEYRDEQVPRYHDHCAKSSYAAVPSQASHRPDH